MKDISVSIRWCGRLITESLLAAIIGILTSVLVTSYGLIFNYLSSYVPDKLPRGLAEVLIVILITLSYALIRSSSYKGGSVLENFLLTYHFRGGYVYLRDLALLLMASLLTVTAGGSVGVVGVVIFAGYIIAKKVCDLVGSIYNKRYFSIVGAVAGISAILKAPLTGMAFSLEMPFKRGIEVSYLVPSLAAAISAYAISKYLFGGPELLLFIKPESRIIDIPVIFHSVIIGAISVGIMYAMYVVKVRLREVRAFLESRGNYALLTPLLLALTIIVTSYFLPEILGSGYSLIPKLLNLSFKTLAMILMFKLLLTILTLELGGAGGVFVPQLIVGAALGALYGKALSLEYTDLLVMAGIAGLFSATNKVLLTSLLLAAEVGGLPAVIPASVSAVIAYILSLYTSLHASQPPSGHGAIRARISRLITAICDEGLNTLSSINIKNIVSKACIINSDLDIPEALLKCRNYRHIIIVKGNDIRYINIESLAIITKYDLSIYEIAERIPKVNENEYLSKILEEIIYGGNEVLAVTNDEGRVIGVIDASDVEKVLRRVIISKCVGTSEELLT